MYKYHLVNAEQLRIIRYHWGSFDNEINHEAKRIEVETDLQIFPNYGLSRSFYDIFIYEFYREVDQIKE